MHIGLTGGIGSGKSTVAAMLADCGAWVVDVDAISRALTAAGGEAVPKLAAEFGPDVVTADGALDRTRMRELAFADPGVKLRLEAVLHPMIREHTHRAAALAAPGQTIVFDVPLLTESLAHPRSAYGAPPPGGDAIGPAEPDPWRLLDKILVVDASIETQVARVQQRSGWSADEVRRVVMQQASREQRRAIADAVICNDVLTLEQLRAEVQRIWQQWHPAKNMP